MMNDTPQTRRLLRRALQRAALRAAHTLARGRNGLVRGVLRLADADDAAALTAWSYGRSHNYSTPWHQDMGLFDFERDAFQRYLPASPASVLVIGCGGGRELVALAERGYRVAGLDPVPALVQAAAARLGLETPLETAALSDLVRPALLPGPFDAVVVGWGAWGHVLRRRDRVSGLHTLRARSDGPVLLSWAMEERPGLRAGAHTAATAAVTATDARAGTEAPDWPGWRARAVLSPHMGCQVRLSPTDVASEGEEAGYEVAHYAGSGSGYPHAVLRPRGQG